MILQAPTYRRNHGALIGRVRSAVLLFVPIAFSPVLDAEEPVSFGAYVERAGSSIAWSTEVGRIRSEMAELAVIGLAVDNCCEDGAQQRRGIRMELVEQTIVGNVYIERNDIDPIARAVAGLGRELVAGHLPVVDPRGLVFGADPDQIAACHGRGEFRFAKAPFDQFMVDYCAADRWSGLSIFVSSVEHRFNFPDFRPADLVRILDQARLTLSE